MRHYSPGGFAPKVGFEFFVPFLNLKSSGCKMPLHVTGAGSHPIFPLHHLRAGVSRTSHPARVVFQRGGGRLWPPSRLRSVSCGELSVVVQGRALPPVTLMRRHRGSARHPTYTSLAYAECADECARRPYADSPSRDGISSL